MSDKKIRNLLTRLDKLHSKMEVLAEELGAISNDLGEEFIDYPESSVNPKRPKKKARETVYDEPDSR